MATCRRWGLQAGRLVSKRRLWISLSSSPAVRHQCLQNNEATIVMQNLYSSTCSSSCWRKPLVPVLSFRFTTMASPSSCIAAAVTTRG